MKKIIFSALACVAFAGSAFASNEVLDGDLLKEKASSFEMIEKDYVFKKEYVVNNGLCEIVILVFDRRGNLVDAVSRRSSNVSAEWCANSYNRMLDMVKLDYSIEDHDIKAGSNHTPY